MGNLKSRGDQVQYGVVDESILSSKKLEHQNNLLDIKNCLKMVDKHSEHSLKREFVTSELINYSHL